MMTKLLHTARPILFFLLASVTLLTPVDSQKIYNSSGYISGRYDDNRFYDEKGRLLGYMNGDRLFDRYGKLAAGIRGTKLFSSSGRYLCDIDDAIVILPDGSKKGVIAHQTIIDSRGVAIGSYNNLSRKEVKLFYILTRG